MSVAAPEDRRHAGPVAPAQPEAGPYVGLVPFREDDAWRFFGREGETRVIAANLLAARLTLLYGASGVGKTSVLRAAVVPYLRQSGRPPPDEDRPPAYVVVYFNSWRDDPLGDLLETVRGELAVDPALAHLAVGLISDDRSLASTLHRWTAGIDTDLLVILDQFEDYFLYHPRDAGEGSFAAEFARAVNDEALGVNFLLSIREDSLAKLDRFKGSIRGLFDGYLRVEHLTESEARGAIIGPLRRYAVRGVGPGPTEIEPELIDDVIRQVGAGKLHVGQTGEGVPSQGGADGGRVEAPHLQLVMSRLWKHEMAVGSPILRAATLRELGGAAEIVHAHLDDVMTTLTPADQDHAASVFHQLVTPSGTKIAHSASDLSSYAGVPPEELVPMLERLSGGDVRVLRPVPPSPDRPHDSRFEIFHDILAPAVLDWRARHLERSRRAALEASLEQQRRRTAIIGAVSVVMVILLVATILSWSNAARERSVARSRELAAEAMSLLALDPHRGLEQALLAVKEARTEEAEAALRRAYASSPLRQVTRLADGVVSVVVDPTASTIAAVTNAGGLVILDRETGERLGTMDSVLGAAFAEDGHLVAATVEGSVHRWDGSRLRHIGDVGLPPEAEPTAFAISRSGRRVAVGTASGTAFVFDVRTDEAVGTTPAHDGSINALAFDWEGNRLGSAGDDGLAMVFDLETGRHIRFEGHIQEGDRIRAATGALSVTSIGFNHAGTMAVTAGTDGVCRVWETASGAGVDQLPTGQGQPMIAAAFDDDDDTALCAGERRAWVFDPGDRSERAELRGHTDIVTSASWSDASGRVITTSRDGTARVWDARTGAPVLVLRGHADAVADGAFVPGRSLAVTVSADRTVRTWSTTDQGTVVLGGWRLESAEFTEDGEWFVAAGTSRIGQSGQVHIWDTATRDDHEEWPLTGILPNSLSVTADGRFAAVGGLRGVNGVVAIVDLETGEIVEDEAYEADVSSVDLSPDGMTVVVAGTDGVLRTWNWGDEAGGATPDRISVTPSPLASARFSPDGSLIVTADAAGTARLWDAIDLSESGAPLRSPDSPSALYDARFNDDATRVVTAGGDGVARVWDVATREQLVELANHPGRLNGAAFDDDGTRVVAGTADGSTAIWDIGDVDEPVNLSMGQTHGAAVNSVEFSPVDNDVILTASDDRSAHLLECTVCGPIDEVVEEAEERLVEVGPLHRLVQLPP